MLPVLIRFPTPIDFSMIVWAAVFYLIEGTTWFGILLEVEYKGL